MPPSPQPPEYDRIIMDVGGDDIVILSGPEANPEGVARAVERVRQQRVKRLRDATPSQKVLLARWLEGEHIYATRKAQVGPEQLTIWLDAPGLPTAIERERQLGADDAEVESFKAQGWSGMVYGTCSSHAEPGEPGSIHICDLTEVSATAYAMAQRAGFR